MSTISNEALPASGSRSIEEISNPAQIEGSECGSEDGTYGEALVPHRVVLDFTPNKEFDNDYVQRKCVAFWDFINSKLELNNLCAISDQSDDLDLTEVSVEPDSIRSNGLKALTPDSPTNQEKTAVSVLEFVEEKGLIDRAFEARLPKLNCDLDLVSYSNDTFASKVSPTSRSSSSKPYKQNKPRKRPDKVSSPKLKKFCKNLQIWNVEHPKSMAPPGPAPVLHADVKLL
ncbi:hypothetical protein KGM_209086 [Danaus plexippus plexippus]|uniref:Uncharacterized protein n=1 Tax=Danaus plexippus plexippus TaxID=278856 RepID=A0A212FPG6_DANPL|nr:hypothetical protein KGM_209086 [Danaus plexippus plexippus]